MTVAEVKDMESVSVASTDAVPGGNDSANGSSTRATSPQSSDRSMSCESSRPPPAPLNASLRFLQSPARRGQRGKASFRWPVDRAAEKVRLPSLVVPAPSTPSVLLSSVVPARSALAVSRSSVVPARSAPPAPSALPPLSALPAPSTPPSPSPDQRRPSRLCRCRPPYHHPHRLYHPGFFRIRCRRALSRRGQKE